MTDDLRSGIAANLSRFERRPADVPGLKAASVAVCVVRTDSVPALLITRRAPGLRAHAGQFALEQQPPVGVDRPRPRSGDSGRRVRVGSRRRGGSASWALSIYINDVVVPVRVVSSSCATSSHWWIA